MIRYEGAELFSPDLSIRYVVLGKGFGLDMARWAQWLISEAERLVRTYSMVIRSRDR